MVRPAFYRSEATGRLAPDVRDLLFGLTTIADDEGWMLWRPAEIAAGLYAYEAPNVREEALEARAQVLMEAGFVDLRDCGCAHLPTLKEHHGVKGGVKNVAIWTWHQRHAIRSATDVSVSDSVSGSSSGSVKVSESSSSRARDDALTLEVSAVCAECHRPAALCDHSPHLRVVNQ